MFVSFFFSNFLPAFNQVQRSVLALSVGGTKVSAARELKEVKLTSVVFIFSFSFFFFFFFFFFFLYSFFFKSCFWELELFRKHFFLRFAFCRLHLILLGILTKVLKYLGWKKGWTWCS